MTKDTFGSGKSRKPGSGGVVGVGYISIMLIFTVICLTIFAVLSFQAAYSNDRLSERGEDFTKQYYAADMQAKKILSELDYKSAELLGGFHFGEELAAAAEDISGGTASLTAKDGRECVLVNYSVEMNDRQRLSVSVLFYTSAGEYRYEVQSWKTTTEQEPGDSHLNVWDGSDI
ncbi:MAG: hypothetical protein ACI4WS_05085 [Oscillospiraceae bacterium]